ncbi:MAG: hypothetical protein H7333_08380 [Bdellovibrionales bacterium]|nr:hypothetical protein [Oligoflexia bacterium]
MSQPKVAMCALILNLFSLNAAFSQDLYQSIRKGGPNPNVDELKKQTHDAERIRRVNEMNAEAKAANSPGKSKIVSHKNPGLDDSPDDNGDKIPTGGKSKESQFGETRTKDPGFKTAADSPLRKSGYLRKEKTTDSPSAPAHIKVTTDDTPEELNFPGTNE